MKVVEDLRQAARLLAALGDFLLQDFVLAPLDAEIAVAEDADLRRAFPSRPRVAETVLDAAGTEAARMVKRALRREARELRDADEPRGVEPADLLEIEDDVGQRRQAGVGLALADGVEEIVRAAEEDEALEPDDVDLPAVIVEQPRLDRRAVDRAVMAVAGERAADDIDRAVLEDEENRGDDDARADALRGNPRTRRWRG